MKCNWCLNTRGSCFDRLHHAWAVLMTTAIQLDHVRFRWQQRLSPVLDIPSLVIESGERIFLHGPSGSGKSTLLGLLGGVLLPEAGSMRLLDHELTAMNGRARDRFRADHIGFLFQQFNLVPYLSVLDNVLLPCRFSTCRRERAEAEAPIADVAKTLLTKLDLAPALWQRQASALSVGQQQRVAMARALIGRPAIIIADEPTSALDAERQNAFLDLLLQSCDDTSATLLFVSHDRRLAEKFTREIALPAINIAKMDVE